MTASWIAAPYMAASSDGYLLDGCFLRWLLLGMAAPWMAASDPSFFADF